ncbi:MAG TPA: OmpA family protein, partial [Chitinophagales bacterium]|nr:OmpA family protein [Chitinophagales bacterium]
NTATTNTATTNTATTKDLDDLRNELNKTINDKLNNIQSTQGSQGKEAALMDFINQGLLVVYFDFNARTPQASSVELIKQVADYLKSNPTAKVKLVGYADAVGGKAYNNKLAQDRADNVKKLLVEQGIGANSISAFSGGIDNTASVNDEAARSLVRRVTFNVIK